MRYLISLGVAALSGWLCASAPAAVTFDWATVGNPGNAADTGTGGLYGAVNDLYRISRTEVTNAQYADFLNAVAATDTHGLYNAAMGSDVNGGITRTGGSGSYSYAAKANQANQPVVYVSWDDAARFVNWLGNGQGGADTESGVYDMSQATPTRAAGAQIFIPTENEWYKAAYYDPALNGGSGGYWTYATRSNTLPNSDDPASLYDPANSANYDNDDGVANGYNDGLAVPGSQDHLTDVGAYADSTSYYGTLDQDGNVWEWNEALVSAGNRVVRGGSWGGSGVYLAASFRGSKSVGTEVNYVGFRVASLPEPASCIVLAGMATVALMRRRRIARPISSRPI